MNKSTLKLTIILLLSVTLIFGIVFFAYNKNSSSSMQTKSQIEELQKKMSEVEKENAEQVQKIQKLETELADTKNEQIKKLEESVVKLEGKTASDNTKALESRLSTAEKSIGGLKTSVEEAPITSYLLNQAIQNTNKLAR